MTTLEATVEIVKSVCQLGGASTTSLQHLLTNEKNREEFFKGIEKLYKKLNDLDSGNRKS